MRFTVLTLFPEMFTPVSQSMTGRAEKNGLISFNVVNIRDFSRDKHRKTDDTPFGGGHGMVMMTDPIFRALDSVGVKPLSGTESGMAPEDTAGPRKRVIYMSPRGRLLDRGKIEELSKGEELVILCGHYEGVDQRVLDSFDVEEISVGDYILTGGELPAMIMIDAVSRLIPGVLAKEEAALDESVYSGLLEYPQYTQPRSYEGIEVPEVLLNGNHELIRLWKFEQSLRLTKERRPDLFRRFCEDPGDLSKKEKKILEKVMEE